MLPQLYRVTATRQETAETRTMVLAPDGPRIEPIAPGQFNMLWTWGAGEVPISVSECTSSGELVHTIRDVGGVTSVLCAKAAGDTVGVRGPFGRGWDLEAAKGRDLVMIAGGIGLAPLRPVIYYVLSHRAQFGEVWLVMGARTPDELLFRAELDSWWHDGVIKVRTTVDRGGPGWEGNVGIVTLELPRVNVDPQRTVAMVCGPEVMMRFVSLNLEERGVTPDRIQVSLERNMQCAIQHCGHCQLAGYFVCTDGPVVTWEAAMPLMEVREL